jgi:hypothetical protein
MKICGIFFTFSPTLMLGAWQRLASLFQCGQKYLTSLPSEFVHPSQIFAFDELFPETLLSLQF